MSSNRFFECTITIPWQNNFTVVATTLALLILLIKNIQTVSYCIHLIDLAWHPFLLVDTSLYEVIPSSQCLPKTRHWGWRGRAARSRTGTSYPIRLRRRTGEVVKWCWLAGPQLQRHDSVKSIWRVCCLTVYKERRHYVNDRLGWWTVLDCHFLSRTTIRQPSSMPLRYSFRL